MKKNYRGTLLVFRQVRWNINVHQNIRIIAFGVLQILNDLHLVNSRHLKHDRHHHFIRHRTDVVRQVVLRGGSGNYHTQNGEKDWQKKLRFHGVS